MYATENLCGWGAPLLKQSVTWNTTSLPFHPTEKHVRFSRGGGGSLPDPIQNFKHYLYLFIYVNAGVKHEQMPSKCTLVSFANSNLLFQHIVLKNSVGIPNQNTNKAGTAVALCKTFPTSGLCLCCFPKHFWHLQSMWYSYSSFEANKIYKCYACLFLSKKIDQNMSFFLLETDKRG